MASSSVYPAIAPSERLLNLVIALLNARQPMTRRRIHLEVAGYDPSASAEVFGRMFERDKELLRTLGVPISASDSVTGAADEMGYLIAADQYALDPVEFTGAELGVLSLASSLWADKVLQSSAVRGVTKLVSASDTAGERAPAWLSTQLGSAGHNYEPLLAAITDRQRVRFTYLSAHSSGTDTREVEPWRLAARLGGWYLVGFDVGRQGVRVYKLSRIEGRVAPTGERGAFEVPDAIDVDALLEGSGRSRKIGLVAVRSGKGVGLRARGQLASEADGDSELPAWPEGFDLVEVEVSSLTQLAEEVAGLGRDAVALAPERLQTLVLERLRAAATFNQEAGDA